MGLRMKDRSRKKGEFTSVEQGVLAGVAQKVGTAVGTVVAALSRAGEQSLTKTKTTKTMTGSNRRPVAKTSKRRAQRQAGKAGAEHLPLKRRRRKSKSAR
jgi:hypothetical protein